MAFAVFCGLALAVGSQASDSLSLVQTRAKLVAEPLPTAGRNLSAEGFATLGAEVGELEKTIDNVQKLHETAVKDARQAYTERLVEQLHANQEVAKANLKLAEDIKKLKTGNAELRKRTDSLDTERKTLLEDQSSLEGNLTTAKEFVSQALRVGKEGKKSSDLDVLDELDAEEESQRKLSDHQRQLDEIAAEGLRKSSASLLQVLGDEDEDAKDVLLALGGQLEGLEQEQVAAEAFLKDNFDKKLEGLNEKNKQLVDEQESLNSTKQDLTELQGRLQEAAKFLEAARDASLEHSRSLRRFAQNVGSQGASLLQVSDEKPSAVKGEKRSTVHHEKPSAVQAEKSAILEGDKHTSVFREMTAQVGDLEKHLEELQSQNKKTMASKKAEYEHTLVEQSLGIQSVVRANAKVSQSIADLQKGNEKSRRQATELEQDCNSLRHEMDAFQTKLATSREFAIEGLSRHNISGAPELDVMTELAEETKMSNEKKSKEAHFDEITGLALVEVGVNAPDAQPEAQELLNILGGSFDQLLKEQEDSEAKLSSKFEQEFKSGAERQEALLVEQASLNKTKNSLEELQGRLQAAVAFLAQTKSQLQSRMDSLRGYVAKLGREPSPHNSHAKSPAASLLQISSHRGDDEEAEKKMIELSDPSSPSVVHALSSQISELEARVEKMQMENDASIVKQKASYEKKLKAQLLENRNVANENGRISTEIDDFQATSSKLEKEAETITGTNRALHQEALELQANFSVAQEFSERLLSSVLNGTAAPDLEVLQELAAESAARQRKQAHESRLGEIAGHKAETLSMLEVAAMTARTRAPAGTGPAELVKLLEGDLDALAKEQLNREETLKSEFDEKFKAGEEQHDALMKEQGDLKARHASLTKLRSRLEAAVAHLNGMQTHLQEGLVSLRAFMKHAGKDGATAVPTSHAKHAANASLAQKEHVAAAHLHAQGAKQGGDKSTWMSWFTSALPGHF